MSTALNQINTSFDIPTGTNSIPGNGSIGGYQWPNQWPAKTTGKLAEALAKAQSEFKTVNKSKTAKVRGEKNGRQYEYEYKYADLADLLNMALPLLAKQGIALTQPLVRKDGKLYVTTRLQFQDEVQQDDGIFVPDGTTKPQEMGTYISYAKRYSLSSMLAISADEDVDGPTDAGETKETKSASGHAARQQLAASEQATQSASGKFEAGKRGRPANSKTSGVGESALQEQNKAGSVAKPFDNDLRASSAPAPTEPPETIANDNDIPAIIGDKPNTVEYNDFLKRLKEHIKTTGSENMKKFIAKETGNPDIKTGSLKKREWEEVLMKLDAAQKEGKLLEFCK
jgi:hypothetical protein